MFLPIGRSSFQLTAIASTWTEQSDGKHEICAELRIGDKCQSKEYYAALEVDRGEIDRELGTDVTWYNVPETNACCIYMRRDADLDDRDQWPELFAWLAENLETLHRVFSERVRTLEPLVLDAADELDDS